MLARLWKKLFLDERPSISLGAFRIAVAVTVGTHVIPTLLPLMDNYLHTAFKEKNAIVFPLWFLTWVEKSSDSFVILMTAGFYFLWVLFLIGFCSQASCILMTLCCYYFYALNSLHIGTLSWDILLVTLFLMCVTGYHGDYFSVDAWFRKRRNKEIPLRPFFIQRLLQMQLSSTFFYTALVKLYPGNWHHENAYYYLINNPPEGVIKHFPFRDFLAASPQLCHWIGWGVITTEFLIAFGLWIPYARYAAICLGIGFHFLLLFTLHVPTIFFFLFDHATKIVSF